MIQMRHVLAWCVLLTLVSLCDCLVVGCFGDSITRGQICEPKSDNIPYPEQLEGLLRVAGYTNATVYNYGVDVRRICCFVHTTC
jgi:hypothetical protein